jgi:hypothetical protein
MALTSLRPWVLDRGFYERMVSDERLYDALLTGALPNQFNRSVFIEGDELPLGALNIALREVVTSDYLRTQSLNVVDEVFDFIEGQAENFEIGFDITPIKAVLAGERGAQFATTFAAALPPCESGQEAIPPGGRLVRCIDANSSVDTAAEQITLALPGLLEDAPDRIILNDPVNLRNEWGFMNWFLGSSVRGGLDIAMLMVILTTVAAGIVGAFLGGDDLRGRLKWLGSSLLVTASLFVLMGLIMATPLIAGPLRNGLNTANWVGIQYSEGFREAVTAIVAPLVQQIGSGFLLTGVVSGLIAFGLLFWSWRVTAADLPTGKIVQVPVRNP